MVFPEQVGRTREQDVAMLLEGTNLPDGVTLEYVVRPWMFADVIVSEIDTETKVFTVEVYSVSYPECLFRHINNVRLDIQDVIAAYMDHRIISAIWPRAADRIINAFLPGADDLNIVRIRNRNLRRRNLRRSARIRNLRRRNNDDTDC